MINIQDSTNKILQNTNKSQWQTADEKYQEGNCQKMETGYLCTVVTWVLKWADGKFRLGLEPQSNTFSKTKPSTPKFYIFMAEAAVYWLYHNLLNLKNKTKGQVFGVQALRRQRTL